MGPDLFDLANKLAHEGGRNDDATGAPRLRVADAARAAAEELRALAAQDGAFLQAAAGEMNQRQGAALLALFTDPPQQQ